MSTELETILLSFWLLVMYLPLHEARSIQKLPPGLDDTKSFLPVTIRNRTQRDHRLVKNIKFKDTSPGGSPVSTKWSHKFVEFREENKINTKEAANSRGREINFLDSNPLNQDYYKYKKEPSSLNPSENNVYTVENPKIFIHKLEIKTNNFFDERQHEKHKYGNILKLPGSNSRNFGNKIEPIVASPVNSNYSASGTRKHDSHSHENELLRGITNPDGISVIGRNYTNGFFQQQSSDNHEIKETTGEKEVILEAGNTHSEVNTYPWIPRLRVWEGEDANVTQRDGKTDHGKNIKRKKAAAPFYDNKRLHPLSLKKRMEKNFGELARTPNRFDTYSDLFVKNDGNVNASLTSLDKNSTEIISTETHREYVEVRVPPTGEKALGSVVYVGGNKDRNHRETCDSWTCQLLSSKILAVCMFVVFAMLVSVVAFMCASIWKERSNWEKYHRVKQDEPPDGNVDETEAIVENSRESRFDPAKNGSCEANRSRNGSRNPQLSVEDSSTSGKNSGVDECKRQIANQNGESEKNGRKRTNNSHAWVTSMRIGSDENHCTPKTTTTIGMGLIELISTGGSFIAQKASREKVPTEKNFKSKVARWLQMGCSVPSEHNRDDEESDALSQVHGNWPTSVKTPRSDRHRKRSELDAIGNGEFETLFDQLELESEEMELRPSLKELQKRMVGTGESGHGFQTIGQKKVSQMTVADSDIRWEIDFGKIARENVEMRSLRKNSSCCNQLARELRAKANKSFPNSRSKRRGVDR